MLHLTSDTLRVDLLDPAAPAERALQGSRFCWGGYVWQVHDRAVGRLLSGPEFPRAEPSPFNGQGLPEAFRCRDQRTLAPLTLDGAHGFVIGAGAVEIDARDVVQLTVPAEWSVEPGGTAVRFTTRQRCGEWATELLRTVELGGRTLRSHTRLSNTGGRPLWVHWFAHPFFALTRGTFVARLDLDTTLPGAGAFRFADGVLALRERIPPHDPGPFLPLPPPRVHFAAVVSHPVLRHVRVRADFVADALPAWANHAAFSLEPYRYLRLAAGACEAWTLTYEFGPPGPPDPLVSP